jgi:hypothetical protein
MKKLIESLGEYFFGARTLKFLREQENFEREFFPEERVNYKKNRLEYLLLGKVLPNLVLVSSGIYYLKTGHTSLLPACTEAYRIALQKIEHDASSFLLKRREYWIKCEKEKEAIEKDCT